MTISKTYFQGKDELFHPNPVWYGEEYTVLMDEDGCVIWVTVPGPHPDSVLNRLGIEYSQLQVGHAARRAFCPSKDHKTFVFKDSVTYKFHLTGKIPQSDSKKKGRTQDYLILGSKEAKRHEKESKKAKNGRRIKD